MNNFSTDADQAVRKGDLVTTLWLETAGLIVLMSVIFLLPFIL